MTSTLLRLVSPAAILMVAVACGRQPVGPSGLAAGVEPTTGGLSAKPSASNPHTVSFAGGITGSETLQGAITGTEGDTLRAQASGSYTWTINRGALLGNQDCEGNIGTLDTYGLFSQLTGSMSFDANEKTSVGERVVIKMTGITALQNTTWEISIDTASYGPVSISGDSSQAIADVGFAVIGFKRTAKGKSYPNIRCAVGFTTTVTPQ